MLLFVLYAVLVWYGAVKWRHNWRGFAWVGGGILGVLMVIKFHTMLNGWTRQEIYLPVLQTLLWSYLLLVGSVGLFVACIPHARGPWCCEKCGYDLTGVPGFADVCPECGVPISEGVARAAERRAASMVSAPIPAGPVRAPRDMAEVLGHTSLSHKRSAPEQSPAATDQQDDHRHAQHQPPSQG
jgi:hypothetical protein